MQESRYTPTYHPPIPPTPSPTRTQGQWVRVSVSFRLAEEAASAKAPRRKGTPPTPPYARSPVQLVSVDPGSWRTRCLYLDISALRWRWSSNLIPPSACSAYKSVFVSTQSKCWQCDHHFSSNIMTNHVLNMYDNYAWQWPAWAMKWQCLNMGSENVAVAMDHSQNIVM